MTTDEIITLANAMWADMQYKLNQGLPIARYEAERLRERLRPVLEQYIAGTVH